jgi:hypothetical protein
MGYELFSDKATKFAPPELTVRSGRIFLNVGANEFFTRLGAPYVHLLWDRKACRLAIKAVKKEDDKAFRISVPKGRRGGTLSAESFLKYIRWTGKDLASVPARWNEAERMLEADLPQERIAM